MASETPRVCIVIVNYRTPDLVIDCLRSLEHEYAGALDIEVDLLDSKSGDGSVEQLMEAIDSNGWADWVTLESLSDNMGFASSCNHAISKRLSSGNPPPYTFLLNPDTVIRRNAVTELVKYLETHPEVGIAGSRLEDMEGVPRVSSFRFPSILNGFIFNLRLGLVVNLYDRFFPPPQLSETPYETEWVSGAAMIIRRQVFEDVGLLEGRFFLYFEEPDFCLRARRKGWSTWHVPTSHVVHFEGQATGLSSSSKPKRRPAYWFYSRNLYFSKNHGRATALMANLFWVAGYVLWRLRRSLQRMPDKDPPYFLRDFLYYNFVPSRFHR